MVVFYNNNKHNSMQACPLLERKASNHLAKRLHYCDLVILLSVGKMVDGEMFYKICTILSIDLKKNLDEDKENEETLFL